MNFQDVIRNVYDQSNNQLRTTGGAGATIFAVVNTSAAGQASVVLDSGKNYIGLTTTTISNPTLYAVVNTVAAGQASVVLDNSLSNIGFATVYVATPTIYAVVNTSAPGISNSMVTVNAGPNQIGSVTVSNPISIAGNVTLSDSKGFIGLVSVSGFANPLPVTFSGNVTLSDSKTYIGLTTATIGNAPVLGSGIANIGFTTTYNGTAWPDPKTYIGLVTVANNITMVGNMTLSDAKTYIGLTTTTIGSMPSILTSGQYFPAPQSVASGALSPLSVDATGKLLLGNPNTYIGLASVNIGAIAAGANYIGLMSVNVGGIAAGANYVGLVSVNGSVINLAGTNNIGSVSILGGGIALTASTVNVGSVSILGGGIGLNAGINGIGFATINVVNQPALVAGAAYVGLASVNIGGTLPALTASTVNIGSVSVLGGGIALTASTVNVGSVSILGGGIGLNAGVNNIGFATIANALAWPDPKTFIGLATTVNGAGTQFMGLVTAWTRNAGTTKTLIPSNWLMTSVGSVATVAVPTNAQTMYITNMLLSSDATVRINIKSGVTYLTGNVTLGITLNPGGGFVMSGSPDSPCWIGLPSGAIVLEKLDLTGTKANIGGNLIYFQE